MTQICLLLIMLKEDNNNSKGIKENLNFMEKKLNLNDDDNNNKNIKEFN